MAIAVKLDDLLHDRRMTLTELADRVGMTLANLSILKTGKARAIRFSTLEAICEALSCQPGDILRFEPEQAEREPTGSEQTERKPMNESTRRISNETQRYVNHHVSALDPLLYVSPGGRHRPRDSSREALKPHWRCSSWSSGCTERWCSPNGDRGTSSCSSGRSLRRASPSST